MAYKAFKEIRRYEFTKVFLDESRSKHREEGWAFRTHHLNFHGVEWCLSGRFFAFLYSNES